MVITLDPEWETALTSWPVGRGLPRKYWPSMPCRNMSAPLPCSSHGMS